VIKRSFRKVGTLVLIVATLIGGALALYKINYPTYTHRYRLTLAVEIAGQTHSGSSVIEVSWIGQPHIPGAGSFIPSVRGQATFVDLGKHGAIVAVLTAPSHGERGIIVWPEGVNAIFLAAQAFGNDSIYEALPQLPRLTGRRNLAPQNAPRLIWFSDPASPKTARRVKAVDLTRLLGSDAWLTSAHVEITDDPIVIDIDKKLPWLKSLKSSQKIQIEYDFALFKTMFIGDGT
jgi:hypothetical protein